MTRKDFVLIAQTIRNLNFVAEHKLWIAERFADSLQATNPLFDRARFITAAIECV